MLSCRHQLVERILKAKSANPATDTAVNGGGKVDHMGGSPAAGFRGRFRQLKLRDKRNYRAANGCTQEGRKCEFLTYFPGLRRTEKPRPAATGPQRPAPQRLIPSRNRA